MAAGLWRYWEIRGYLAEGRRWLERMMDAVSGERSVLRANALTGAGNLAFMQGDFRAASSFHEASLALHRQMGDRQSIAYAANNLANTAFQLGDHARARELYEETVALTRELGDRRGVIFGSINLAAVATQRRRHRDGRAAPGRGPGLDPGPGRPVDRGLRPRYLRHTRPAGRAIAPAARSLHDAGPADPRVDGRPARRGPGPDPPGRPGPGRRRFSDGPRARSARAWRSARTWATCPAWPARWRSSPASWRPRTPRRPPGSHGCRRIPARGDPGQGPAPGGGRPRPGPGRPRAAPRAASDSRLPAGRAAR